MSSDHKEYHSIEDGKTYTDKESTTSSRTLYQESVAASQQARAYREKLAEYNLSVINNGIPEENAMLNVIDEMASDVSSFFSEFSNFVLRGEISDYPVAPVKKPVEVQDIPTIEELSRLSRARDAAFFSYMDSLEQDMMPSETNAFEEELTILPSTEELAKPYLNEIRKLRNQQRSIQEQITILQQAQRTWMDFIIETFIPSFVLKMMSYLTFKELVQEAVDEYKKAYSVLVHDLETQVKLAHETLREAFGDIEMPQNLKSASTVTLSKAIHSFNNDSLFAMYTKYEKEKTITNLINFYRLARQMQYIHEISDAQNKYGLETVIMQLEQLHPNMTARFQQETDIVQQEMKLMDKYMASPSILEALRKVKANEQEEENAKIHKQEEDVLVFDEHLVSMHELAKTVKPLDAKTIFFVELDKKYRAFLKNRSLESFEALYQHMHDHPQFRHHPIVKATRAMLKDNYGEAYQSTRQHYIQHMDEATCDAFISKYESLKYDHVIYKIIMKFMHEPTVEGLIGLKLAMLSITDSDYDQDPKFNEFLAEFMEICSKAPITSMNDLESQRYSEGSFDETMSEESGTTIESQRSRSFSGESTAGNFTVAALELHNSRYDPRMFTRMTESRRILEGNQYEPVPTMVK